ncbi:MAG: O-antigen ligase family protein [Bacteroidales bacterium]|jgi:O-antigen ligase|nr:O-antigen ligase family protein [Bacteroidales bacterium]
MKKKNVKLVEEIISLFGNLKFKKLFAMKTLKHLLKQLSIQRAILIILASLFILLPYINADNLMDGTIHGKLFVFLYIMFVIIILLSIQAIINFIIHIRFSKLDIAFLIWIMYILLNSILHHVPLSNRLLEFYGLIILYIALRQIEPSKYVILLITMIIGAFIQAIHGNLQLWGIYPSHHGLFSVTGNFFNPGPFAGYLASVFSAAIGLYMFKIKPFPSINENLSRWIIVITLIAILTILPRTGSRAAWLTVIISSMIILIVRYPVIQRIKKLSQLKCVSIILVVCIVIGAGFIGLFHIKADSANGRLLIWKTTLGIIADHPVNGVGFDCFKSIYMIEQANFFKQNPESPKAMVASDTNYSFNEFIQHTAENGVIGLILMLTVLFYTFRVTNKSFGNLAWIAKSGIVGISIFALFSYPAQILPIKINLICYLACLSTLDTNNILQIRIKKHLFVKCALSIIIIGGNIVGVRYLFVYRDSLKNWKQAYQLYANRNYNGSLKYYEKAWTTLNTNGDYLTHYGKALNMAGKHEQAINVLLQSTKFFPNIVVYTALGDSYKLLSKFNESEQSYLMAWYMNPSRFYPKYLLAKLYDEIGQIEKAIAIAQELLNKKVKIESTAIKEIRIEMKKILQKYQNSIKSHHINI